MALRETSAICAALLQRKTKAAEPLGSASVRDYGRAPSSNRLLSTATCWEMGRADLGRAPRGVASGLPAVGINTEGAGGGNVGAEGRVRRRQIRCQGSEGGPLEFERAGALRARDRGR